MHIETLFKKDLDHSADSVEFCPHSPFENVFTCANYYLNEETKVRKGRLLLFSIDLNLGLVLEQILETEGVLDQKWCLNKINGFSCLGVVNSNNTFEVYKLSDSGKDLIKITSYKFENEDNTEILLLSLDWSTGKYSSESPEIIISDSKGQIHLLQFNGGAINLISSVKTHGFEAWIAAFYYWDPNIFFSGGDDCLFVKYDKRTSFQPVSKNRSHEAGVTCLHSNKNREFELASGSYDTNLRIWDVRNIKSPLKTLQTPGTMWRIKYNPFDNNEMLIACMLGGVHIVDSNKEDMEIVCSYEEHKNIAYGSDWSFLPEEKVQSFSEDAKFLIASCSFYDKLLCVSLVK